MLNEISIKIKILIQLLQTFWYKIIVDEIGLSDNFINELL